MNGNVSQTVWLCRHGNRIDFVDPTWKGSDPHLSPDGCIQARETGARLRGENIRHIFASPFFRAIETASYIADALDLAVKIEHGICEWLKGGWFPATPDFISLDQAIVQFPRVDRDYCSKVQPEYPETREDVNARCALTMRRLLEAYPEDFLLIGHGASTLGAAKALVGHDVELSVGLCALTKIVRQDGEWQLELNGDASHLTGGEAHAGKFN